MGNAQLTLVIGQAFWMKGKFCITYAISYIRFKKNFNNYNKKSSLVDKKIFKILNEYL